MASPASRPSARRMLILLAVLAGALLALSIVQRDRALEQVYEDAQERAELYTGTVLRTALGSQDFSSASLELNAVLTEVKASVLTDPKVARVRVWRSDGTLLFSIPRADRRGDVPQDPAVEAAAIEERTRSRFASDQLSRRSVGSEAEPTPLFQTFVPLRVEDAFGVVGVAQIDQYAVELQSRADDPWWVVQLAASGVTTLLALMALISVARGMRRRPAAVHAGSADDKPGRRKRRDTGLEGGTAALRERLDRVTTRAQEAEEAARSYAAKLQQVSSRLESVEKQTPDERVAELKEALRRSEAERAMLRAGRPETVLEAEVRVLRRELREAQSHAKAAEALVAGGGELTEVQAQLSAAARQVEEAFERAKVAEGRADAAEDRARSTADMATAAEQRIDLLESKLQEVATSGIAASEDQEPQEAQRLLAEAQVRAEELERRTAEAESRLAAAQVDGPPEELLRELPEELLRELEERLLVAEARSTETHARVRAYEEQEAEAGSAFRQRLGRAAGRKLTGSPPAEEAVSEPALDLRAAIARSLLAPLTRATGLTLSLQGLVESGEGKNIVRQLSAALRRLDRVAADLHEIHRIADGSLPLDRRRVELGALVTTTVEEADRLEDRLVRVDADTVHARVDPARARQIVEGMLDAARERTRSGAAIVVRVRDTDAGARVSVEDDNRTPASIGPEMSLATRLAELHGTEITPDGSSFRVMFAKDERP